VRRESAAVISSHTVSGAYLRTVLNSDTSGT